MTEEEAKTKWCPHVRDADENHGSYNRWKKWVRETIDGIMRHKQLDELDEGCLCIGSECTAWRLDIVATCPACDDMVGRELDGKPCIECGGIYQRHGYCGLAGKP